MPFSRHDLAKQTYSLSKMKHPQQNFFIRHKIPITATICIATLAFSYNLFTKDQEHRQNNSTPQLHRHIFSNITSKFSSGPNENPESWSSTPTWRI